LSDHYPVLLRYRSQSTPSPAKGNLTVRFLSFFLLTYSLTHLLTFSAYANDCSKFRSNVETEITSPVWRKTTMSSPNRMDMHHGNTVATMSEEYGLEAESARIRGGTCVFLKKVTARIGYNDFSVMIDSRHAPGFCAYEVISEHEDEHIRAYLSVINDNYELIARSVGIAAAAVNPVFVKSENEMDRAMNDLNASLQNHPELKLLRRKLKAEEDIRNKHIDRRDNLEKIKVCF